MKLLALSLAVCSASLLSACVSSVRSIHIGGLMIEVHNASKTAVLKELERASMAEGYSRPALIHSSGFDDSHFTMQSGTKELYLYAGEAKDQFGVSLDVEEDSEVIPGCKDLWKISQRVSARFPQAPRLIDDAKCPTTLKAGREVGV